MKKKPAISLLRGNTPNMKNVGRLSQCWRCLKDLVKNDKVFDVPGRTKRSANGKFYREYKRYCIDCMKLNIRRTENELQKIKNNL